MKTRGLSLYFIDTRGSRLYIRYMQYENSRNVREETRRGPRQREPKRDLESRGLELTMTTTTQRNPCCFFSLNSVWIQDKISVLFVHVYSVLGVVRMKRDGFGPHMWFSMQQTCTVFSSFKSTPESVFI